MAEVKYYTPDNTPEITLFYVIYNGEVDIVDCYINSKPVSEDLYGILIDKNRPYWEGIVISGIKKQSEIYREDQLVDNYELKKLMEDK